MSEGVFSDIMADRVNDLKLSKNKTNNPISSKNGCIRLLSAYTSPAPPAKMCILCRTRIVQTLFSLRPNSDCSGPPLSAYRLTKYCEMKQLRAKTMIGQTLLSDLDLDGEHMPGKCIF